MATGRAAARLDACRAIVLRRGAHHILAGDRTVQGSADACVRSGGRRARILLAHRRRRGCRPRVRAGVRVQWQEARLRLPLRPLRARLLPRCTSPRPATRASAAAPCHVELRVAGGARGATDPPLSTCRHLVPPKAIISFLSSVPLTSQVVPPKEITAESIAAEKEKKKFRAHKLSGQVRDISPRYARDPCLRCGDGCRRDLAEISGRGMRDVIFDGVHVASLSGDAALRRHRHVTDEMRVRATTRPCDASARSVPPRRGTGWTAPRRRPSTDSRKIIRRLDEEWGRRPPRATGSGTHVFPPWSRLVKRANEWEDAQPAFLGSPTLLRRCRRSRWPLPSALRPNAPKITAVRDTCPSVTEPVKKLLGHVTPPRYPVIDPARRILQCRCSPHFCCPPCSCCVLARSPELLPLAAAARSARPFSRPCHHTLRTLPTRKKCDRIGCWRARAAATCRRVTCPRGQRASRSPAAGGARAQRREPPPAPAHHPPRARPSPAPRLRRRSSSTIRPSSWSGPATRRPTSPASAFATSRWRPPRSPTPRSTRLRSSPTVPRRPLSCRGLGTIRTWGCSSPTTTSRCRGPRRRRARLGDAASRGRGPAPLPPAGV